ncbi:hypothetical protein [uncultured Clostridium sp.]|uniref:hypothetical protein n=1 Tax=uncultured Clostridium sp. TaxID=59620 RepID=UPI0028E3D941|nr:hypothetical protein [uncultured Clostridium sp.]
MSSDNISINNLPEESSDNKSIDESHDINPSVKPSDDKAKNESKKPINQNLSSLLSDIENSKNLNNILTKSNVAENPCADLSINTTISQTADTLKNINSIKDELCKLPLDPCESEYIANSVFPLANILYLVSTASLNLSTSVNVLTTSSIVHPKKSDIKDTIGLIYDINEECEDLFKVIKKRLKILLND